MLVACPKITRQIIKSDCFCWCWRHHYCYYYYFFTVNRLFGPLFRPSCILFRPKGTHSFWPTIVQLQSYTYINLFFCFVYHCSAWSWSVRPWFLHCAGAHMFWQLDDCARSRDQGEASNPRSALTCAVRPHLAGWKSDSVARADGWLTADHGVSGERGHRRPSGLPSARGAENDVGSPAEIHGAALRRLRSLRDRMVSGPGRTRADPGR